MYRPWGQAAIATLLAMRCLGAQGTATSEPKTFYTGRDAVVGAGFLAASGLMSLFDVRLEHWFQDTTHLHVRVGRKLDGVFTHINETTLTVGGLALYGIGELVHAPTLAQVAFHAAESVAGASITAQLIRGPLGRTRPLDADQPYGDQYEFHFFQGFTNFKYRSFPSIHSSSGFAAASAIVAEIRLRDPRATWWVGVPAYLLALTPGLSRMYLGEHWASDVFAGAYLGTYYGWRVVDYSHAHPTTPIDRFFLGSVRGSHIVVGPSFAAVSWSRAF